MSISCNISELVYFSFSNNGLSLCMYCVGISFSFDNLSYIVVPNRELADLKDYIDIRSILTSRGCINKCDFCPTHNYWGSWRGKSAENVVKEIEYLIHNYNTEKIIFLDDNATANRKRMQKISNIIIEKKIKIKLGCLASINTYDKNTF